jgi:hypothetical protein
MDTEEKKKQREAIEKVMEMDEKDGLYEADERTTEDNSVVENGDK